MTQVVIFIPGTMGTKLYDNDGRVWPGKIVDFLFGYRNSMLQRLKAIPLREGSIISEIYTVDVYKKFIEDLEDCEFRESDQPPTLYTCPYDWRLPLQGTTGKLRNVVNQAHNDHGSDVEIILIGHSQGGLMARFYLESGLYGGEPGFGNVKQLIFMGVPHRGLHLMLTLIRGDRDYMSLSAGQIRELLNTSGLSSTYLMLPIGEAQKTWHNTGSLPWSSWDLLPPASAQSVGLSSNSNLADAVAYHAIMSAGSAPASVRYFSFVGTDKETYSGALVDTSDMTNTPLPLETIERNDGGDGTVPIWSAWLPGYQGLATGGKHMTIFEDHTLRKALRILLGCAPQEVFAMFANTFDFQIDEEIYAPGAEMQVTLYFDNPLDCNEVEMALFRTEFSDDETFLDYQLVDQFPVTFPGSPNRRWRFNLTAPTKAGVYQLQVRAQGLKPTDARFFVQDKSNHDGDDGYCNAAGD